MGPGGPPMCLTGCGQGLVWVGMRYTCVLVCVDWGADQPIQWLGLLGRLVPGLSSRELGVLLRGKDSGIGVGGSGCYL